MGDERAMRAEQEVGRVHAFFPILPVLGNRFAATRPWEGMTIGLNLHLTTLTVGFVRELALGGARCAISAANTGTTDPGAVDLLRSAGAEVYTGGDLEDRHRQVLAHDPKLLLDLGFELSTALLDTPEAPASVRGVIETTRSGTTRLRQRRHLPFPVVNINEGQLKHAVESRHGVGEGIWHAVSRLTAMHLPGRRVAVIGYGPVGRGLAAYARAGGMSVEVVETEPIRRLFAHYDGFPTPSLSQALARARIIVTATGGSNVLDLERVAQARDGAVLVNAGRGGDEIDVDSIRSAAVRADNIADQVVRYRLESGKRIVVLGDGYPLNIVLSSGSPEPVLLHFAVAALTLEWLAGGPDLTTGELVVPPHIEQEVAKLALTALDGSGA